MGDIGSDIYIGDTVVVVGDRGVILEMSMNNEFAIEWAFDVLLKDVSQAFAISEDRLTSQNPPPTHIILSA